MDKLIWVALPLLAAVLLLAVLALRGQPPSRAALNVWSSVLLLMYLLGTAGLGLFWVAQQQLPVFDWHYLFGYLTLVLLALHLWLNLPRVWQHLTRRRAPARPPQAAAAPPRRPVMRVLLALGGLALVGGAYRLGHQRGRAGAAPAALGVLARNEGLDTGRAMARPVPSTPAMDAVLHFHALSGSARGGLLFRAPTVSWGDAPPPFKGYPGAPRLALPSPRAASAPPPAQATPTDRSAPAEPDAGLTLQALARILWHTAGITARRGGLQLRASPSSGALFSTELYVLARGVTGLAPGLWHHDARTDALQRLADADIFLRLGLPAAAHPGAAAWVVATAVFRRTGYKYRDRTYRYVLVDLGHALENLRMAAHAAGVQARLLDRFDEARLAAALGLDEAEEGVLAVVALQAADSMAAPVLPAPTAPIGPPAPAATASAAPRACAPSPIPPNPAEPDRPSPWQPAPPADPAALRLGITAAMHRASSLRGPVALGAAGDRPTAPVRAGVDWPAVIARRRSVRRFAATPLPRAALQGVLAGLHLGAALLSPAVRVHVLVHAVEQLAPGAYRHEPGPGTLVRQGPGGPLRRQARAAALDQDVIGDAAAVFVLTIAHADWSADPAGPARGYRHALLEAGLVGERLYLEAGARGLGLCAVGAFFDDEAQALIGVDPAQAWVVHFAGLGVPA